MLLDMEKGGREIKEVWFIKDYTKMVDDLSADEFRELWDHVNGRFDEKLTAHDPRITTSWEPGSDWTGTPFQPLYRVARYSQIKAAQLMGLVFCAVAIQREERWGCHHCENAGDPINGRTYYPLR